MSDRTELIARLAPGYVECVYADAERGTDDGARKAISKEGLNGTVEVGLFLPDRPGVQLMYGPVIWLCLESVARDLQALRGKPDQPEPRRMLEWLDEMVERTTGSAEEHAAKYLRETFAEALTEGEFEPEQVADMTPESTTRCPRCQYDHARPDDELMAMAIKYGVAERLALNCRKYREALREALTQYGCEGCRENEEGLHWPDCAVVKLRRLVGLPVKWKDHDDVLHVDEDPP